MPATRKPTSTNADESFCADTGVALAATLAGRAAGDIGAVARALVAPADADASAAGAAGDGPTVGASGDGVAGPTVTADVDIAGDTGTCGPPGAAAVGRLGEITVASVPPATTGGAVDGRGAGAFDAETVESDFRSATACVADRPGNATVASG